MQNSMMHKRTDVMRQAAEFSNDGIAIIDRGPFGDTTFMTSTYRKYKVSLTDENSYIIDLLRRYLGIDYPKKTFLILRVDASVAVTHARYMGRESATPGNKVRFFPPCKTHKFFSSPKNCQVSARVHARDRGRARFVRADVGSVRRLRQLGGRVRAADVAD